MHIISNEERKDKTFVCYGHVRLLVPITIVAKDKAEAISKLAKGEGRPDYSKPIEEELEGFREDIGVIEVCSTSSLLSP